MSAPVLAVSGLNKSFGDRRALVDVGFTLEAGTLAAVLGPSGVGKSTLFRCIAGLESRDSGALRFEGSDLGAIRQIDRRRIAVVFQQFNLVRRLTALDNVLAGRLGHVSWQRGVFRQFTRADKLLALECLERVGMLEFATQRADTLSGGQQQRVAIARALAQRARLILADEPIASLDPAASAGVLQLLKDIAKTGGVAVLASLHQVDYARAFADRILGMSEGRIVIDAPTGALDEAAFAKLYARAASRPDHIANDVEQRVPDAANGLAQAQT
jgi:phosphonate transport system ATP-binding protein